MRRQHGRARRRHSRFPTTRKPSTAQHWDWRCRGIRPVRRRSRTICEKRFPEDTSVRSSYLPSLDALLALNRGEPSRAIEILQVAVPNELGTQRSWIHGNFGALYPVYVRGLAYLALHQGAEAAAEFRKILDHRGIVISDPVGAVARLQLARAYVLMGDIVKAKPAYQDFFRLWKGADPDIPILQQANAEYAKLP